MPADGGAHRPPGDLFYSPVVRSRRIAAGVLTELCQPERRRFPRHGHERPYLSFLFAGSYVERCGLSTLEHRPPTLAYHPSDLEHQDEVGESGGRLLVVEIDPAWVESLGGRLAAGGPRLLKGAAGWRAAWRLRRSLAAAASDPLETEELVLDLLAQIGRERSAAESGRPRWLAEVIDRLHAEYRRPLSVGEIAGEAGVHPSHLWRVFRRAEGCSPTAYVQRLRCREVFRALATPEETRSLAELALAAGFADQSHCTRVFKRLFGAPPGAVRRSLVSPIHGRDSFKTAGRPAW